MKKNLVFIFGVGIFLAGTCRAGIPFSITQTGSVNPWGDTGDLPDLLKQRIETIASQKCGGEALRVSDFIVNDRYAGPGLRHHYIVSAHYECKTAINVKNVCTQDSLSP